MVQLTEGNNHHRELNFEDKNDNLTPEERKAIAGYTPNLTEENEEALLDDEYLILDEEEGGDLSQNGLVRGGFLAIVVLLFMGLGGFIWWLVSASNGVPQRISVVESEAPVEQASEEELGRLKAELALRDQAIREQNPESRPSKTKLKPIETPKPTEEKPPQSQPSPRKSQSRQPVVTQAPPPSLPQIEPEKLWNQLAIRGQISASAELLHNLSNQNQNITEIAANDRSAVAQSPSESNSQGLIGILTRTPVEGGDNSQSNTYQVSMGTSSTGVLKMPLVWTEDLENSPTGGRFLIELTADLVTPDGAVALSKGSLLVADARNLSKNSPLVYAEVMAVLSEDDSGEVREQTLPEGALIVLGEDKNPLVAERMTQEGNGWGDELLVGVFNSLGTIGEVLNEADVESTVVSSGASGNVFSSQISQGDADIFGAALEGFFKPLAESVEKNSRQANRNSAKYLDAAVVREGTPVTVMVKKNFSVER